MRVPPRRRRPCGGGPRLADRLPAARGGADALHSATFFAEPGAGGYVAEAIGAGARLDFPNIPYPYVHQLEALGRLGLGAAWLRAVCHDNAVRLLGL